MSSEDLKKKFFSDLVELLKRLDCVEISHGDAAEVIWKEVIERAVEETRETLIKLNRYNEGPLN
jgi:hypothetical protein